MKTKYALIFFFLIATTVLAEEDVPLEPFGNVHVYQPAGVPELFLILISGDGGWFRTVPEIATALARDGAFVVGVGIKSYVRNVSEQKECVQAGSDFHNLAVLIQKKYNLKIQPILMGYSSGATLAYAVLAQSPPNSFLGVFSFGFCPDFEPALSFCREQDLDWTKGVIRDSVLLLPSNEIQTPWVAFQGMTDRVCDPDVTTEFVRQIPNGKIVLLPQVGHGFRVIEHWMPEFRKAVAGLLPKPLSKSPESNHLEEGNQQ